jgi:hypothetical protein
LTLDRQVHNLLVRGPEVERDGEPGPDTLQRRLDVLLHALEHLEGDLLSLLLGPKPDGRAQVPATVGERAVLERGGRKGGDDEPPEKQPVDIVNIDSRLRFRLRTKNFWLSLGLSLNLYLRLLRLRVRSSSHRRVRFLVPSEHAGNGALGRVALQLIGELVVSGVPVVQMLPQIP